MFEDDHKDHKFEKLMNVYDKHLQKIKTSLSDKLNVFNRKVNIIDKYIEKIEAAKQSRMNELDAYKLKVKKRLDNEMDKKVSELNKKKQQFQDDIAKLDNCHDQIISSIESSSTADLIKNSDDLVQFVEDISSQLSSQNCSLEPMSTEFSSEIVPEYQSSIFEIVHYNEVKQTEEIIYSEPLVLNGITWRLKVYPNGNGQAKDNYISVFLEMVKGYSNVGEYDYKIEMINHNDPQNNVSREYTSEFEVGECWGYNRFYRIESIVSSDLEDSNSLYLNNGTLKFKFYVRASNFGQEASDQAKYIQKLELKVASLKTKLLTNDIQYTDDEKDEEAEREDLAHEDIDRQPMPDNHRHLQDYHSDEDKDGTHESIMSNRSIPDAHEFEHSHNDNDQGIQGNDLDTINDDSLQADDIVQTSEEYKIDLSNEPSDGLKDDSDKESDNLNDINSEIEESKELFEHGRVSSELFQPASNTPNTQPKHDANIEEFMKELESTENHFKKIHYYNNSFNKEMKKRFKSNYRVDSDNDSYNESFEVNHEDQRSDKTSEGNLSREDDQNVFQDYNADSINKNLIQVSPDSNIDNVETDTNKLENFFSELINRDLSNMDNLDDQYDNLRSSNLIEQVLKTMSENRKTDN